MTWPMCWSRTETIQGAIVIVEKWPNVGLVEVVSVEVIRSGGAPAPELVLCNPGILSTSQRVFTPRLLGRFGYQHPAVSHLWEWYLLMGATCSFLGQPKHEEGSMQGCQDLVLRTQYRAPRSAIPAESSLQRWLRSCDGTATFSINPASGPRPTQVLILKAPPNKH